MWFFFAPAEPNIAVASFIVGNCLCAHNSPSNSHDEGGNVNPQVVKSIRKPKSPKTKITQTPHISPTSGYKEGVCATQVNENDAKAILVHCLASVNPKVHFTCFRVDDARNCERWRIQTKHTHSMDSSVTLWVSCLTNPEKMNRIFCFERVNFCKTARIQPESWFKWKTKYWKCSWNRWEMRCKCCEKKKWNTSQSMRTNPGRQFRISITVLLSKVLFFSSKGSNKKSSDRKEK